jgi:hypothetical protein
VVYLAAILAQETIAHFSYASGVESVRAWGKTLRVARKKPAVDHHTVASAKTSTLQTNAFATDQFATQPEVVTSASKTADDLIGLPLLLFTDNFTAAMLARSSSGTLAGLNLLASLELGEPRHANKPGGHSLWIKWRAPATGVATFETVGTLFDTLLAVYSGSVLTNLTLVTANDDSGGLLTSRVQFNAVAGRDYCIAVDGFGFAVGNVLLNWAFEATDNLLPVITSLTGNQTVGEGESLTLGVTVQQQLASVQWLWNGVPIRGETNSLLYIPHVTFDNVGSYAVQVSLAGASVVSDLISVQINETDGGVERTAAAFDKLVDAKAFAVPAKKLSAAKSGTTAHGYSAIVARKFSALLDRRRNRTNRSIAA